MYMPMIERSVPSEDVDCIAIKCMERLESGKKGLQMKKDTRKRKKRPRPRVHARKKIDSFGYLW